MEQELEIGDTCSVKKESAESDTLFSAYFDDLIPQYLMFGMTYEQFMYGDCTLAVYYRKKYLLEEEIRNRDMWVQGAYIYATLCKVAPLFSIKPQKPENYLAEPIPFNEKQKREQDERKQGEAVADYMNAFMARINEEKEGNNGKRDKD